MIEATGILTLVQDPKNTNVSVPDVLAGWDYTGSLYTQLLELLGQEVYVLVLPKKEMLSLCQCGHTKADHFKLQNWEASTYPSMDQEAHVSWYSHGYCCPDKYCTCKGFQEK